MPIALLRFKSGKEIAGLATSLAAELPNIIAPNLTLEERERHDGQVTPADIIVWLEQSKVGDVNNKDIEIVIWAHDFPERKANLEERKEAIVAGVRKFLADYDRNVSGFVWVLLQPTAFGQI